MNTQRETIYAQRRQVLDGENLKETIINMVEAVAEATVDMYYTQDEEQKINDEGLIQDVRTTFGIDNLDSLEANPVNRDDIIEEIVIRAKQKYEDKETEFGSEDLRELERVVMLKVVDQKWMDHIDNMDELKNGINLRAYGQKDPVVQYRMEGFDMFEEMISDIKVDVVKILLNIHKSGEIRRKEVAEITGAGLEDTAIRLVDGDISKKEGGLDRTVVNETPKIGRNEPCPCGSGKKYKNCCGK